MSDTPHFRPYRRDHARDVAHARRMLPEPLRSGMARQAQLRDIQRDQAAVVSLAGKPATGDFFRGFVTINVTYTHTLCLVGKQHGPLAYTLTLLPGEK